MTYDIAVIGGDGIGPEVTEQAQRAIVATGVSCAFTPFHLGADRYKLDGEVCSDETVSQLRGFDAILLGAVGAAPTDTAVPSGIIERGMLLKLRFALDHYINLRPFQSPQNREGGMLDFVFVREGTEGAYAGEGGVLRKGTPYEIATQGSVNTRHGVERCVRFAFELARTRERKQLTLVHKTNVLTYAGDLWHRTFREVGEAFADVETEYCHVDAACIYLHDSPERFDVIVTDNLFGDILTDLAGAVSGGIGLAASGNINPERRAPSMFEPVHGSAPDIAGTGRANPLAAIRSGAMLLAFLGEQAAAERVESAVAVLSQQPELLRESTTTIGDAAVNEIEHGSERNA